MKAIKRELKEWEHEFVSMNGRKPDKRDIASDRVIAKKYKLYAKLKAEGEPAVEANDKVATNSTLRNSVATAVEPKKLRSSPARVQSPNIENDLEESFKTTSHGTSFGEISKPSPHQQGIFSNYEQKSSQETIMDDEDRAAMDFFNSCNYNSNSNNKFQISKEELLQSTSIAAISSTNQSRPFSAVPEYSPRNITNSNSASGYNALPSNFKIRKSTIASGPIATDESIHFDAQKNRQEQRERLYNEPEAQSYTLRTFTPPPQTPHAHEDATPRSQSPYTSTGSRPATTIAVSHPELQDFATRRKQLELFTSCSSPEQSSTSPNNAFALQHRAPSALGAYTTVPSLATQIRVVTPTNSNSHNDSNSYNVVRGLSMGDNELVPHSQPRKHSKPSLDLPAPRPPTTVRIENVDSAEDDSNDQDSNASAEDLASRSFIVKPNKQATVKPGHMRGNRKEEVSPVIIPHKRGNNNFFPVETEPPLEETVQAFGDDSPATDEGSSSTLAHRDSAVSEKNANIEEPVLVTPAGSSPEVAQDLKLDEIIASPQPSAGLTPTFLTNPKMFCRIPQNTILKCRLTRKKNLLDKAYPTFHLYNETTDTFLLAARKQFKSALVSYVISTSADDLSKDSTHYVAKLKGNFGRTCFVLSDARFYSKSVVGKGKGLKETACVSYSKTVLPRELSVAIPATSIPDDTNTRTTDIMADIKSHNTNALLFLKNKPPRWNETTQSHCLNFGGRVTQPSIKNFQLVMDGDETIILQFGRCGPDTFSLDARWPLTTIEAFSVAVTTFDAYDN